MKSLETKVDEKLDKAQTRALVQQEVERAIPSHITRDLVKDMVKEEVGNTTRFQTIVRSVRSFVIIIHKAPEAEEEDQQADHDAAQVKELINHQV